MSRKFLILVAMTSIASAASAQETNVREQGDALLEKAGADDLFANESAPSEGAILLRHKASGFSCVMNPDEPLNAVTVYPGSTRGDDVGCTSRNISGPRTLYITRSISTLAAEAQMAAAAIRTRYPNARTVDLSENPPMFALPPGMGIPEHVNIGFETRQSYEQVTLGMVDGWAVKYRFSAPPGGSHMSALLESSWIIGVAERAKHQRDAAPPEVQP